MREFILSVLFFMAIFSFKIPIVYNSSLLAFLLSFFFIKGGSLNLFSRYLSTKVVWLLMGLLCTPFIYALFSTTAHGVYDFSFLRIVFGNIIYFIITSWLVVLLFCNIGANFDIEKIIFRVFLWQSLIILLAFIVPDFRDFIQLFQDQNQAEVANDYYGGGVRGLALSGGQFFNLSAVFALVLTLSFIKMSCGKFSSKQFAIILFVFLMSLTTGRTTFVGFMFGLVFLSFSTRNLLYLTRFYFFSIVIFVFIYFIQPPFLKVLFSSLESYSKFAFEFIYNYQSTGKVSTESTEHLKTMYFIPEVKTIIFGDGAYTNADGSYYMKTDSGYMRQILLFGLFGLVSFMMYNFIMIYHYSKSYGLNYKYKILLTMYGLLMVLHYKGEVFGYLITVNQILVSLFSWSIIRNKIIYQNRDYT